LKTNKWEDIFTLIKDLSWREDRLKYEGFYDVYKSNGEFVKKINLIEATCIKIINIKVYNLFNLKPNEFYLKKSKEQK
jgi:hypothetical protein